MAFSDLVRGTTKLVMVRVALGLAIVAVAAHSARAGVAVDPDVPFSRAELGDALAARGAAPVDVAVSAVSPTAVELRTPVGRQRVELGDAHGPAAARLVALQLAAFQPPAFTVGAAPPAPQRDAVWSIGAAVGGGAGTAAIDFSLFALRVDAIAARGPWRWGVSVEWLHGLARTPDGVAPADADLYPVRAVAGFALSDTVFVAGPEIVAYNVSSKAQGLTAGAGGGVRLRLVGGAGWHAVASADVDGFLHRVAVERNHMQFAATPRVALTAALGLVWGSR
jgi:hypothetical protein